MTDTMDPKHIETVDQIISGYNKVKTLYKENSEMIRKVKAWFKEHRTVIIISVIVLGVVGFYVYKQYQEVITEADPVKEKKKPGVRQGAADQVKEEPEGEKVE